MGVSNMEIFTPIPMKIETHSYDETHSNKGDLMLNNYAYFFN